MPQSQNDKGNSDACPFFSDNIIPSTLFTSASMRIRMSKRQEDATDDDNDNNSCMNVDASHRHHYKEKIIGTIKLTTYRKCEIMYTEIDG